MGRHLGRMRGPLARDHPHRRGVHRRARGALSRSGRSSRATSALPEAERRIRAAALAAPRPRSRLDGTLARSATTPIAAVVLDFLSRSEHPRLAALGTSCPDHFLRTKVRPLVLDLAPGAPTDGRDRPAERAARGLPRRRTRPTTSVTPRPTARRCAAPIRRSCSSPGVGMFSLRREQADRPGRRRVLRQRHQRDARRRGGLDLRADPRVGEVPDRVLGARGGQARPGCPGPEAPRRPGRVGDRRRIGHRQGDRPPAGRGGCLRRRRRHRRGQRRVGRRARSAGSTSRISVRRRRDRRGPGRGRVPAGRPAPSAGWTWSSTTPACRSRKPLLETTARDWDLQHDVMARGSFLVSREAARIMIDQGIGGDLVYIVSKNAVFAGPNNVAYGAAKADQAHQVRLLAAELGEHGIRVNGDQPRRRRPGLGHLRQGLGCRSRPDLRHPRGQARRVLRPADAAQAGGAARARCRGGLRPGRRRPEPDDRAAHPGRCRRRGRLPAVTRWGLRRGRPRRIQRPGHGRPR